MIQRKIQNQSESKTLGSRNITVSYDANNRAISNTDTRPLGNRSISYDARGNVTTLGGLGFVYDMSGQPVSSTGIFTSLYTYDGNCKRVKTVINGTRTIYNIFDASGALIHTRDNGVQTDYIRAGSKTVARQVLGGTVTYMHPDHLGSAETGTDSVGGIAWRETHSPFGEVINPMAANNDEPAYTGHIRDAATGLNYMQARYQDPVIGRFLSIDPVGFTPDQPFMFNRYAYVGNDPVGAWDPIGEKAWLISRPLGSKLAFGQNHMFVVVVDDKTGIITRFSYGPQGDPVFNPGKLVSLRGSDSETNTDDNDALTVFLADPVSAAAKKGISAALIDASDADVKASGQAVDRLLGTKDNPAATAPNYNILPIDASTVRNSVQYGQKPTPGTANSNTAARAVSYLANPNATQVIPNKGKNPGVKQYLNIVRPDYATRIRENN